jgi:hypothetical protein
MASLATGARSILEYRRTRRLHHRSVETDSPHSISALHLCKAQSRHANASYIGCVVSLRLVIHQSTPLDLTDASLATLSLLRASVCTSVIRSRLRPSSCLFLR